MQHPKQSAMILARKFDLFVNDLTHVLIAELLRSLSLVRAGARGRVEATTRPTYRWEWNRTRGPRLFAIYDLDHRIVLAATVNMID